MLNGARGVLQFGASGQRHGVTKIDRGGHDHARDGVAVAGRPDRTARDDDAGEGEVSGLGQVAIDKDDALACSTSETDVIREVNDREIRLTGDGGGMPNGIAPVRRQGLVADTCHCDRRHTSVRPTGERDVCHRREGRVRRAAVVEIGIRIRGS